MHLRKAYLMSISTHLGLDVNDPLDIIARRWPDWAHQEPALFQVPNPMELWAWFSQSRMQDRAHWRNANRVLQALARLAAEDGVDDLDAALVLAWLMLPTANTVARWYQADPADDVDAIVAGRLFILTRTYPWRARPGSVGANIGRDLRKYVGGELGLTRDALRLVFVDPLEFDDDPWVDDEGEDAAVTLSRLLDDVQAVGAISRQERQLLEDVVAQVEEVGGEIPRTRSLAGLTSPVVMTPLARKHALTPRTLRRRVTHLTRTIAETAALWEVA